MAEMDATIETSSGGEYEREPVPNSALMGPGKFWGMYAGEHAAGTEFMIGPLFLGAGASLQDLILGLLLGNILAVLTWRYLVVPIAMAKRMTLYYQLERIAGGSMVKIYNVVNGDDGQNWTTAWIVDDPKVYIGESPRTARTASGKSVNR